MSIPIRLAADIGGTFTDVVLESEAGFQSTKVLTTLNQPEIGVMQGIDELLRLSKIEPGQITHVIHGTTLGTNTVIERKGAKTAFLTTEGFRDILEMGYEKRLSSEPGSTLPTRITVKAFPGFTGDTSKV